MILILFFAWTVRCIDAFSMWSSEWYLYQWYYCLFLEYEYALHCMSAVLWWTQPSLHAPTTNTILFQQRSVSNRIKTNHLMLHWIRQQKPYIPISRTTSKHFEPTTWTICAHSSQSTDDFINAHFGANFGWPHSEYLMTDKSYSSDQLNLLCRITINWRHTFPYLARLFSLSLFLLNIWQRLFSERISIELYMQLAMFIESHQNIFGLLLFIHHSCHAVLCIVIFYYSHLTILLCYHKIATNVAPTLSLLLGIRIGNANVRLSFHPISIRIRSVHTTEWNSCTIFRLYNIIKYYYWFSLLEYIFFYSIQQWHFYSFVVLFIANEKS